ncbi:MAG TPA: universal stress protein [Nitrososphaeraceae archaeon]
MKILVPHDGSRISNKAFDRALEFAQKLNYEIILLHVIDFKLLESVALRKYIQEKYELEKAQKQLLNYLKTGAESMLKENVEKARKMGVKIRFKLGIGSAHRGILDVAADENVDLIIMGSKGMSSEEKDAEKKIKILGSIARQVSELASCPVMIIK